MPTALLIEDSEVCRTVVTKALESTGLEIVSAATVADGSVFAESADFDIVFLDLLLPDGDGLNVLQKLEAHPVNRNAQVYILTSKDDLATKVLAFNMGAVDFLTKPVNPVELRARVEARLRKVKAERRDKERLRVGQLTIYLNQMKVTVGDDARETPLHLTLKEFKILAQLAQCRGSLLSREDLMKSIWGRSTHVALRTVDSHICALRRKLGNEARHLECVAGVGYRIVEAGAMPS